MPERQVLTRPGHRPTWLGASAAVGALVLLVGALGAWTNRTDEEPGDVTTPELVGLDVLSATTRLEQLGLSWRFAGSDEVSSRVVRLPSGHHLSPSPAADVVVGQDPAPRSRIGRNAILELRTRCSELARTGSAGCY